MCDAPLGVQVRQLLGLPQHIRQDDGSHEQFEALFDSGETVGAGAVGKGVENAGNNKRNASLSSASLLSPLPSVAGTPI